MTSLTNFYFNFQSPDLVFLALDAVGMLVQYVLFGRFRSAGYIHPDVAFSFLDAVRMFCSEGAVRKVLFGRLSSSVCGLLYCPETGLPIIEQ